MLEKNKTNLETAYKEIGDIEKKIKNILIVNYHMTPSSRSNFGNITNKTLQNLLEQLNLCHSLIQLDIFLVEKEMEKNEN